MVTIAWQKLSKTEKVQYSTTYKNELTKMKKQNPEAVPSRGEAKREAKG